MFGVLAVMPQPETGKLPERSRRGRVVEAILHSIFTGALHGGDRLVEEDLADTLGVSRTPVREALGELVGIGLVAFKPNHGAVVRPFGPAHIRELFHIRRVLEAEAARLAAERIPPAELLAIRDETQAFLAAPTRSREWAADTIRLDKQFHELIRAHCGSERLAEEIGRYRGLVDAMRQAVGNSHHAQDVALVEHTRIIDRLLAGDADGAAEAMRDHIIRGAEAAVTAIFEARSHRANGPAADVGDDRARQAPEAHVPRPLAAAEPVHAPDTAGAHPL